VFYLKIVALPQSLWARKAILSDNVAVVYLRVFLPCLVSLIIVLFFHDETMEDVAHKQYDHN
jgi:hypothetical protein